MIDTCPYPPSEKKEVYGNIAEQKHKEVQRYGVCKRKLRELSGLDHYGLSKTRKHYIREHIRTNKRGLRDHRLNAIWLSEIFWNTRGRAYGGALMKLQALARGMIARRKVHFALLSADPDALAMATAC